MTEENKTQSTGSARPTGKRQVTGAATTSSAEYVAKKAPSALATAEQDAAAEGNKIVRFIPQVVEELKKVIWPTAKQMVVYTLIVLAFLIILTGLVFGVDFLAGLGVEKVLSGH